MLVLKKTEEEKKQIEKDIKNSISFTEPNDIDTKEYVNKIIKKKDQISNALYLNHGRINSTRLNNVDIFKVRLFDNEFEKFISNKKEYNDIINNYDDKGFKAKQIPPNFMFKRKKQNKTVLRKIINK